VVFDTASLVDLLQDRRDQMDLAVAAVIDAQGRVVASTEPFAAGGDFSKNPLYLEASKTGKVHTGLMVDGGRLLRVSIQPLVDYGLGVAQLLVAERIDIAQAQAIADIGHADVALLADTGDGLLMVASTLPADQQTGLQDMLPERGKVDVKRAEITIAGTRQDVSVEPLFGVPQARLVSLVRPRTDAASFLAVRLPFLIACSLLLLALAVLAWWLWRQVLRPAHALADVIERAAHANDMHMSAPVEGTYALSRIGAAINQIFKQQQSR
jgi:methyl-accepting chemotaxis protein